jgi:hypothetical protein
VVWQPDWALPTTSTAPSGSCSGLGSPTRWHMGVGGWAAALRAGGITVTGPWALRQALPTWNAGPEENAAMRAERGLPVRDLA